MRTDLARRIRTLGRRYGMSNIFSIATSSQVQVSLQQGLPQNTRTFLLALRQLLHTEHYDIIHIRDDYPHLIITAYRANH